MSCESPSSSLSFINRYSSDHVKCIRTSFRVSARRMRLYYPECRRCATGRKGRVFIRCDEMHSEFRAGRKIAATAQWPSQWSRQVVYEAGAENRCRVYQLRLGKIRAVLCRRVLGACQLTSRCAVYFQFTTGI